MKSLANCPDFQYAIIRASSTHNSPELMVLAYADEKLLRNLIAASIIAFGFASRWTADAAESFHQRVASQHMHPMSPIKKPRQRFSLAFHFGRSRLTDALTCWKGYSDLCHAVQFMFATAVLVLYSRNVVSATIRTALGV